MPNTDSAIKRREFIIKSAVFFAGSLLGLNYCSKATACPLTVTDPKIAIIIDDIGFSKERFNDFLDIGNSLTFSVLPKRPYSSVLADKAHRLGYEVMLHQPMEPIDPNIDPGAGAVYVKDSPRKITRVIEDNICETPFVTGINNHMGSRFTANGRDMKEALSVIKNTRLFFVDSLTTSHSTGYRTAKRMNISTLRRNVFLDNIRHEIPILIQLLKLKRIALRDGSAIGIGHPFPETAKAVKLFYQGIKHTNISMVPISRLLLQ